jgi:TctA family transporter
MVTLPWAHGPDRGPIGAACKCGCEPAPLLLGFVLGPLLEENLRRALIISRGDPTVFVTRPISAALLVVAVGALVLAVLPAIRSRREVVFQEEVQSAMPESSR